MTKRDFIELAGIVRRDMADLSDADRETLIIALTRLCERNNERFDRARFIAACNIKSR